MKVIFTKTAEVKEVSDGYARNFLIPNGEAIAATPKGIKEAEALQKQKGVVASTQVKELDQLAKKCDGIVVEISAAANEDGTLFGAVAESAILEAVKQKGIILEAAWVSTTEPVKHIGDHIVSVALPNGAKTTFTLRINNA